MVIFTKLLENVGKGSYIVYNGIVVCCMKYVVCCKSRINGRAV
nr:MAG TPA: hypothetical protein [Bacteriophage sp.]